METTTTRKRKRSAHQPVGRWITKHKRLAIYLRDGMACIYCGTDLRGAAPSEITLDHLVCRSHEGGNGADNLVTACRACNSTRGNKLWQDYATGGASVRILAAVQRPLNIDLARAIIAGTTGDADLENAR